MRAFHPYDPARVVRGALRSWRGGAVAAAAQAGKTATPRATTAAGGARAAVKRALRGVLYSPPALRLLGHMILAVAVKPGAR